MTREEAIRHLEYLKVSYPLADISEWVDMAIEALHREDNLLKSLETNEPIYDMVDVVRCKDCRWYDNRYGEVCHNPRYGDGWANYPPPYVDEDYWCKDGVPRDTSKVDATCETCADRAMCIMSAPDGKWKACKDYRPSAETEAEAVREISEDCKPLFFVVDYGKLMNKGGENE